MKEMIVSQPQRLTGETSASDGEVCLLKKHIAKRPSKEIIRVEKGRKLTRRSSVQDTRDEACDVVLVSQNALEEMLALKSQQSTAPFSLSSATESTLISSKQSREKHCLQAEPESGNFNEVREYLSSIREDLQRKQSAARPSVTPHLSKTQGPERHHSVDFILRMASRLRFQADTAFMAVCIYDRISNSKKFEATSRRLKAMGCLFVASKYQEIAIPKAECFASIDGKTKLTREAILRMEEQILLELQFDLSFVSSLRFVDLLCIENNLPETTRAQAYLFAINTLAHQQLLQKKPSTRALACLSLVYPEVPVAEMLEEEHEECRKLTRRCLQRTMSLS